MPRSVNHVASKARRTRILKLTRGYFGARKNVWTVAKNTWEKGLTYAYRDRRNKKRAFRALWIQRINAAARINGMSYSQLMGALTKAGIEINRKVLADLAVNNPEAIKNPAFKPDFLYSVPIGLSFFISHLSFFIFYLHRQGDTVSPMVYLFHHHFHVLMELDHLVGVFHISVGQLGDMH